MLIAWQFVTANMLCDEYQVLGCRRLADVTRAPSPASIDSLPWRAGNPVMAQCMLGRPAIGSNSTVLRSGRQGPPLPDTDLPQAAGSNFSSNIPLEPDGTDHVKKLVRPTGRGRGR